MIGIPYASPNGDGTVTCPVCSVRIAERHDAEGERLSNEYGAHYEREHARPRSDYEREGAFGPESDVAAEDHVQRAAVRAAEAAFEAGAGDDDVARVAVRAAEEARDQGTPAQSARLTWLNDQWGAARWSINEDDVLDVVLDDGSVVAVETDGEWHYR